MSSSSLSKREKNSGKLVWCWSHSPILIKFCRAQSKSIQLQLTWLDWNSLTDNEFELIAQARKQTRSGGHVSFCPFWYLGSQNFIIISFFFISFPKRKVSTRLHIITILQHPTICLQGARVIFFYFWLLDFWQFSEKCCNVLLFD